MDELFEEIAATYLLFVADHNKATNGSKNKAAAARARKSAMKMRKQMKEYRTKSLAS